MVAMAIPKVSGVTTAVCHTKTSTNLAVVAMGGQASVTTTQTAGQTASGRGTGVVAVEEDSTSAAAAVAVAVADESTVKPGGVSGRKAVAAAAAATGATAPTALGTKAIARAGEVGATTSTIP